MNGGVDPEEARGFQECEHDGAERDNYYPCETSKNCVGFENMFEFFLSEAFYKRLVWLRDCHVR